MESSKSPVLELEDREEDPVAMGGAEGCLTNLFRFLPNFFLLPPEWRSVRGIDLVDVMAEGAREEPLEGVRSFLEYDHTSVTQA